jgi:hypothetical protein
MTELLPTGGFRWIKEPQKFDVVKADAGGDTGFILEVDLDYPSHLHQAHNDYPLAPEKIEISSEMLSPYCQGLAEKFSQKLKPVTKLAPNLMHKRNYVVHLKNLQFYINQGLILKKVHRVLKFRQEKWLKDWVDINTKMRQDATNDFDRDFFKLNVNSVFGKCMENMRNKKDVKLVTNQDEFAKLTRKPHYDSASIFNESFVAVNMTPRTICLCKPIYAGFSILDLSKLFMFRQHYEVLMPLFGPKMKLLMTDTDSFIYRIQCDDVYEIMSKNEQYFDLSNYPHNHPIYSTNNKKVLGKLKDENAGKPMTTFVGTRAKMYSFICGVNKEEHKRAKGVKKAVVKRKLRTQDYIDALQAKYRRRDSMNTIRSVQHIVYSMSINKISLSPFDDKRYIADNGIDTYAHGHYLCK